MRIAFSSFDEVRPLKELSNSSCQRNVHSTEQIERLALIMREHGVRQAIHVSKQTGEICFGHGRKQAALLNGWTEFPVVYQDFDTPEEEYACVQSDNAIAHWAELDLSAINNDLGDLGPDFNLDLLGIQGFDLDPDPPKEEKEKPMKAITCPHCGEEFEAGQAKGRKI